MAPAPKRKVNILETTLRDGSYAVNYSFTARDTAILCRALEAAGLEYIEIGHGVGMNADPVRHGKSMAGDEEHMAAARDALSGARYGMFCIPGIARLDDIDLAKRHGMGFIRIGVDIHHLGSAEAFIKKAKDSGMLVAVNYLKTSSSTPDEFAESIPLAERWGADILYVVDSAGGMFNTDAPTQHGLQEYFHAIRRVSGLPFGFHGHNNLEMAVANCLEAVDAGAAFVDSSLQGLGRSSGNACTEVLVAVLKKRGYDVRPTLLETLHVGHTYIYPILPRHRPLDIMCGYSDFHSSFLPHVLRFASKYNADPLVVIDEYAKVDHITMNEELLDAVSSRFRDSARRFPGEPGFGSCIKRERDSEWT